ncbi:MAG TPA: chemotaxis protein CheW [Verrucomicrobiota bacterium]|jgi:chemotaxis-related protein WspB|nr:chemotaxis protein CheW [Verrucomicrobiota bacterium]HQL76932.1 chemotaxis protein CheW [Verrucomicrobiota bacterium]
MLFLLFQLGKDRYALEASRVVEVVPLLEMKALPQAPRGVAGIFNYRGRDVPAVDLSALTLGQPATERLSTRIIIVNHPDERGSNHLLGLIAEQATETLRKEVGDFADSGMNLGRAPHLGPMLLDNHNPIQLIYEQRLLPEAVRKVLFSETLATGSDAD